LKILKFYLRSMSAKSFETSNLHLLSVFSLKVSFRFIVTTTAEDNRELFRMVKNYPELTRKQLSCSNTKQNR